MLSARRKSLVFLVLRRRLLAFAPGRPGQIRALHSCVRVWHDCGRRAMGRAAPADHINFMSWDEIRRTHQPAFSGESRSTARSQGMQSARAAASLVSFSTSFSPKGSRRKQTGV